MIQPHQLAKQGTIPVDSRTTCGNFAKRHSVDRVR